MLPMAADEARRRCAVTDMLQTELALKPQQAACNNLHGQLHFQSYHCGSCSDVVMM